MQRKIIVSLILIGLFLTVGISLAAVLMMTKTEPPKIGQNHVPLVVSGVTVMPQSFIEPIAGYATARADRYAKLSAQVPGKIIEIVNNLKVGDQVKKGEPLIRIAPKEYEYLLDRAKSLLDAVKSQQTQVDVEEQNLNQLIEIAKSELSIAQREHQRVKDLFNREMAPRREYDLAQLALERGRRTLQSLQNNKALLPDKRAQLAAAYNNRLAEVELAQLNLERCTIAAPFDGRTDELNVEIGEHVIAGQVLVTVLDPTLIEVPIELPASVRPRVQVGAASVLTVDSVKDMTWTGRVTRIGPSTSESTRTFELFVEVDNSQQTQQLVPGYFVRATISGPTWENVLVVPRGSIKNDGVFICRDGKAYSRNIRVKKNLLDQSIIAGIEDGTVVITSNLDALYDGAPIRLQAIPGILEGKTAINSNNQSMTDIK
ncbi:MAG: efflux RND transporter periplasmic adaptor subunit [Planctomycetota bacterium]